MEPKHMKLPLGGPAWLCAMAEDKEEMANVLPAETERRKREDGREILGLRDAANRMRELEEDAARLDWLEKTAIDFEFNYPLNGSPRKNYASGCVLRHVIDAARRASGQL